VPLDEVVQERSLVGQQLASGSGVQRAAFSVFAGHRKRWIQILDDGAGDDPERADSEGAFFYHFKKTDAGNDSKAIRRVIDAPRSASPDPKR
jgi:hypothetical protein